MLVLCSVELMESCVTWGTTTDNYSERKETLQFSILYTDEFVCINSGIAWKLDAMYLVPRI